MTTVILTNDYDTWYSEKPSRAFNLCTSAIKRILGSEPKQIQLTVSRKAFKGSQRAVWDRVYLSFGKHRVNPSMTSIDWARELGFFDPSKNLTIYIKLEPLP